MVFCSLEFLIFFVVVAASYWALPSRWVRGFLVLASVAFLTYAGWRFFRAPAPPPAAVDPTAAPEPAWASLSAGGELFWLAAIVLFGSLFAWARGPDRGRVWLLLAASFYFYASWNPYLACLIFVSTVLDYFLARGIERLQAPGWRRALVGVSVTANLGLLCYFKYTNFFLASLQATLQRCGAATSVPLLNILAPIGISFYTFEAINFVVDVYRGKVRAERNLANFILFILFFPHLVAGPIVRARDFLPQVRRRKRWDWLRVQLGVRFFLMGLFKKWVIADRMALFVEPVFKYPPGYGAAATWMAVLAYSLQIYGDFSGYTDMAIGAAHLLGFRLAKNFDMPYLARNVSEFWRRWHISLSSWLRDYLFIPLGGSRGGRWRTCLNLLIVMALGGLWHGASWTFVAWGVLHGLLLIGHRLFADFCEARPRLAAALRSRPGTVARVLCTFLCVSLCWVFFRAQSFHDAVEVFKGLVHPARQQLPAPSVGLFLTVAVVALCHALAQRGLWKRVADRLPAPVLGVGYALLLALCLVFAPVAAKPFIYFQF